MLTPMYIYACVCVCARACVRVCVCAHIHIHTHGGSFYQLPAQACHHARTHTNVRMCVYISHPSCRAVQRSVCAGRLNGSGHLSSYGGNIRARLSPRQRVDVQSSVEAASHIDHRGRVDIYTTSLAGCANRLSPAASSATAAVATRCQSVARASGLQREGPNGAPHMGTGG